MDHLNITFIQLLIITILAFITIRNSKLVIRFIYLGTCMIQ